MSPYDLSSYCRLQVLGRGPWWWSSGRRARFLLWRSHFESRWSLQFFWKVCVWKTENKQKEARVSLFKNKGWLEDVQRLWHSWLSSRLRHQRTWDRIQSSATFEDRSFPVFFLKEEQTKIMKKRKRMGHLKTNTRRLLLTLTGRAIMQIIITFTTTFTFVK